MVYIDVVAKPIESRNFDGKIFIERVTNYEAYKKSVTCERFTDDGLLNALLRAGDWHTLLVDGELTLGELRRSIAENYYLDDDIASRLVLRHYQPRGEDRERRPRYYADEDYILPPADLVEGRELAFCLARI